MRTVYLALLSMLALPAAAQSPAFSVDTSTVALYTFDGANPDTTFDLSGNDLHAFNDGTTSVPGRYGSAREFDGVDDRIDMDAVRVALQGSSAWTLEYIAAATTDVWIPVLLTHTCGNGWWLYAGGTSARYAAKTTASGGCNWSPDQTLTIPDIGTDWHYFALAFGGGLLSFYIDGHPVESLPASGVFQGGGGQRAWIGHSDSGDGFYYSGLADELRVSDVARSAGEICMTANDLGWPCAVTADEPGAEREAGTLYPATPNPFADRTTLAFALPEAGRVTVAVYDVLGRAVAVLADGERAAGRYEVALDGRGLPSGVYLVRMTAEGFAETRRVTLLR
ncbi:MAG: LamG-like jellyroll fold domain-containing protein [Bacteroidota bacterium]